MTLKENFSNYWKSPDGGSRSSGLFTLSVVPRVGLGLLTVLPVDPVGELAEGSRVARGWLVNARGVGVELELTRTSSVNLITPGLVPHPLRVELAWEWLVDTRGVGTVPGLTDGSSLTEVAAVACLVISGVRPALGEIWRDREKPEKAKASQRYVRRKHSCLSSCLSVN